MAGVKLAARRIEAGESEWLRAHEALSRLAKERAAADAEEGRWLLLALRSAVHVHLGFGSFGEYVERLFGYRPRSTQEKLRVAAALEQLPVVAQALAAGALCWSAVRELSRVAVGETEREWLELARGKSVHELEELVAGKIPGDKPCTPVRSFARRHVLRFEVSPETLALWREAMDQLQQSSNCPLDDDSGLLLMARHVLGGPRDEGRASYQIALCLCPECGKGQQQASGDLVSIGAEVVAMAQCDGQHLGFVSHPPNNRACNHGLRAPNESPKANHCSDAIEPALPDTSERPDATTSERPDATTSERPDATTSEPALASAPADTNERLGRAGGARASGSEQSATSSGRSSARVGARARQSIAPATRRAVRLRDHRRCVVPGCRNVRFLDLHHIELSSEGGGNEADNLVTLCAVHHRAVHRGALAISGRVSTRIVVQHADGRDYGGGANPSQVDALASTFVALRGLGFREGEIRRAQAEVSKSSPGEDGTIEGLLRATLTKLTGNRGTQV